MLGTPSFEVKSSISSLSRKPRPVDGDAGAEAAVERVGDGDGVALGVDDGEVGGLRGLVREWRELRAAAA